MTASKGIYASRNSSPKERLMRRVVKTPSCWLWTGAKCFHGYGQLKSERGGKMKMAHRVSYEVYVGPIPEGLKVLHECDNPPCVNPGHLRLGTQAENNQDREAKGRGRQPKGVAHNKAKLTEAQVARVRSGGSASRLAAEMGVTKNTILDVRKGKTWRHLL